MERRKQNETAPKWLTFHDSDEYIYPTNYKLTLSEFLRQKDNTCCIQVGETEDTGVPLGDTAVEMKERRTTAAVAESTYGMTPNEVHAKALTESGESLRLGGVFRERGLFIEGCPGAGPANQRHSKSV